MQETLTQSCPPTPNCPSCGTVLRNLDGGRGGQVANCPSCGAPPAPAGRDFTPISEVVVDGSP